MGGRGRRAWRRKGEVEKDEGEGGRRRRNKKMQM